MEKKIDRPAGVPESECRLRSKNVNSMRLGRYNWIKSDQSRSQEEVTSFTVICYLGIIYTENNLSPTF